MLLQVRWIISTVCVAAPDVRHVAWQEHAGDVSEPSIQQPVELIIGDEVVCQWPILGSELLVRSGTLWLSSFMVDTK